jgi:hypothetical protein
MGSEQGAGSPVAAALDGASRDPAVSGDAMRWSPDLPPPAPAGDEVFSGLEAAVGLGATLGLDGAAVQRLVTGALFALPSAAGRPQLTAGGAGEQEPLPG